MLFRVWSGTLHRPTKDLDLLGHGDSSPEAVAATIRQLITTVVADDGMTFDPSTIDSQNIREDQEYDGVRVLLTAYLGNARIPMQIDIGFGDAVTPEAEIKPYPTLLDSDAPILRMYPPVTVVAEKVEAAVTLGMANSRMKDYYDLFVLLRDYDLKEENLTEAIVATFRRRQTMIPEDVPIGFSESFSKDKHVNLRWTEFIRRMNIDDAPSDFTDVINKIQPRICRALLRAHTID
ncbi:MAG: nucleotidyl transferase AbiEii/AbiGii toxin family protein [Planctomycetes bacterium]|nr:nucleotidyl transferase AbiEii/AbiGii toxin family protein [Planctomycetota bacterium]MBL6996813.1 nucleotidyl transferase AbiEii/AbiGii toxin family protein [Phycisphaerales bacterium]